MPGGADGLRVLIPGASGTALWQVAFTPDEVVR